MAVRKSGAKITWTPKNVTQPVADVMEQRLRTLGPIVQAQAQFNVSIPTAMAGPSRPGEYPHLETGKLHDEMYWRLDRDRKGLVLFVGTNAIGPDGFDYGLFHEYTSGRSFLRRTLGQMWQGIRKQLSAPIPGFGKP